MDIREHQRRRAEFLATPLGAAFNHFERTMENYWIADGNEHVSFKRLRELSEAMSNAREDLIPMLRKAAGLAP